MTYSVLQITDCHLVEAGTQLLEVDTQATLVSVLTQALAEREPDAIVATGDIAHDARASIYERFLNTVQSFTSAPLMVLPGNHDVLACMQEAQLPVEPVELGDWLLVGLDSHEDDQPKALIEPADKQAVQRRFEACPTPAHALLFTHHHLVPVNCPWLDSDRIQMPQDLINWAWQVSHGRLRGCVHGHVHQEVNAQMSLSGEPQEDDQTAQDPIGEKQAAPTSVFKAKSANDKSVPVWGSPSTCFQFQPRSQTFAVDASGPGYRWLYLQDDGSVGTEVKRIY